MSEKDKIYYIDNEVAKAIKFEENLSKIGIQININSDLYKIGCKLLTYQEKIIDKSKINNFEDIRSEITEVLGYTNFINKLLPILNSEYISEFLPHLRLLNNSSITQNLPSKVTDQGSNKLFELYIASLCYPDFNNIKLDNPSNSKGDNPDVKFKFKHQELGIACKVLHSQNPKTIYDNIKNGISQIINSDVNKGIVALNIKNFISYDAFWPIVNQEEFSNGREPVFGCYRSYKAVVTKMQSFIISLKKLLETEIGFKFMQELFNNDKVIPGIAILAEGVTGVDIQGTPVPTFLGFISIIRYGNIDPIVSEVIEIINDKIH